MAGLQFEVQTVTDNELHVVVITGTHAGVVLNAVSIVIITQCSGSDHAIETILGDADVEIPVVIGGTVE